MNKHDLNNQLKLFDQPNGMLDDVDIIEGHIDDPLDPTFDPFDHLDKIPDIKCENDSKINVDKAKLPCEDITNDSEW